MDFARMMNGRIVSAAFFLLVAWILGPLLHRLSADGQIESSALLAYIGMSRAGLLLMAVWVALSPGRARRVAGWSLYGLVLFGFLELACAVAYRATHHTWHFWESIPRGLMNRSHPYLVGLPAPEIEVTRRGVRISHNAAGHRGVLPQASKPAGLRRVATIGGSSTYCVGISDGSTWPDVLDARLGADWDVINLGVPGHTSAEHLILASLRLSDVKPDHVIVYSGWNDARCFGIRDLASYYSDFRGRQLYDALLLPRIWTGPDLAVLRFLTWTFQRAGWLMKLPPDEISIEADSSPEAAIRALALYRRNLTLLIAVCRAQGIEPILVPQVLNCEALTSDSAYGWLPYVKDRELCAVVERYNTVLREVGQQQAVTVLDPGGPATWSTSDFIDQGHFSETGCRKFGERLAEAMRSRPAERPPVRDTSP